MTGERVFCSRLKRKVPSNLNQPRHRRERYCPRDEDAQGDCTCFFSFCRSLARVCSVVRDEDWPPENLLIKWRSHAGCGFNLSTVCLL